jgi:rhodanese-related sulfurtransferase
MTINQKPVVLIAISILSGVFGAFLFETFEPTSQEELIQEFYDVETATHVSPHHIRKHIAQGDTSFLLVDLRSQEEYEDEHVVGAVNVPAYADPNTSAYGDVERIVGSFRELQEEHPDTELIVYCYSIPCMTGRKIGKMLADQGVYVKHLGVGWNEWRYHWELWNHPHEWDQTNVLDYVTTGSEPGTFKGEVLIEPCIEGQFGC